MGSLQRQERTSPSCRGHPLPANEYPPLPSATVKSIGQKVRDQPNNIYISPTRVAGRAPKGCWCWGSCRLHCKRCQDQGAQRDGVLPDHLAMFSFSGGGALLDNRARLFGFGIFRMEFPQFLGENSWPPTQSVFFLGSVLCFCLGLAGCIVALFLPTECP